MSKLKIADIKLLESERSSISKQSIKELAISISENGLLQPILIRTNTNDKPGIYTLIAGYRRILALKTLGIESLDDSQWIGKECTDEEFYQWRLVENLQREDVHPADEAKQYKLLNETYNMSAKAISEKIGKTKDYVAKRLSLNNLIPIALTEFQKSNINFSIAFALSRLPQSVQEDFAGLVNTKDWTSIRLTQVEDFQRRHSHTVSDFPWDLKIATAEYPACAGCPSRTSCSGDLFPEEKKAKLDYCLDDNCYTLKHDEYLCTLYEEFMSKYGEENHIGILNKYIFDVEKEKFAGLFPNLRIVTSDGYTDKIPKELKSETIYAFVLADNNPKNVGTTKKLISVKTVNNARSENSDMQFEESEKPKQSAEERAVRKIELTVKRYYHELYPSLLGSLKNLKAIMFTSVIPGEVKGLDPILAEYACVVGRKWDTKTTGNIWSEMHSEGKENAAAAFLSLPPEDQWYNLFMALVIDHSEKFGNPDSLFSDNIYLIIKLVLENNLYQFTHDDAKKREEVEEEIKKVTGKYFEKTEKKLNIEPLKAKFDILWIFQ